MTDLERAELEKDVLYQHHKVTKDLRAYETKAENIAEILDKIARGLRENPELVTGTPSLEAAGGEYDYRDALNAFAKLSRQEIVSTCSAIRDLKESLRQSEKKRVNLEI